MTTNLPLLCECERKEAFVEHRDMRSTYVLWVLHRDASHVVFLDRAVLGAMKHPDGRTFLDLLLEKPSLECCKMMSRTLLGVLRYKPDYVVIVADGDTGAPLTCGLCMGSALRLAQYLEDVNAIRRLAEGSPGCNNALGKQLTELFGALADKGFFEDPKNRRYRPGF